MSFVLQLISVKTFYFEEVNIGLRMSDYLAQINREKRLSFQAESANFMRTGDVCLELISHFKLLEVSSLMRAFAADSENDF